MSKRDGGRDPIRLYVCGHCGSAARRRDPWVAHRLCIGDGCACGAGNHRLTRAIAESMAKRCKITLAQVYERHGRKLREYTPEQKAAFARRMATARERAQQDAVQYLDERGIDDPYSGLHSEVT